MTYTVAYGGERLDRIAKKLLQTEKLGTVEALLEANPGLAATMQTGLVSAGTIIRMPAGFTPKSETASFTLAWK
jgi:phage tail protein X